MEAHRREEPDFVAEAIRDRDVCRFSYAGRSSRIEVACSGRTLRIPYSSIYEANFAPDLEAIIQAFWELAPQVGVTKIEVEYRSREPLELYQVRPKR